MSFGPKAWIQEHWDARAAANFMLGGMGAGLMAATALAYPDDPVPVLLSLGLIAAGLAAVWLEIGKKLRAINVFFNPFTSWMTRESFAAVLVFAFGAASLWKAQPFLPLAGLAALAFVYCQGRILHASKGIPAWRAPQVVLLVVSTGIAEGAGIALFFTTTPLLITWFGLAVILRGYAWMRYEAAVKNPALLTPGKVFLQVGTAGGLLMAIYGYWMPLAATLAAILVILTGLWLKFALVTRASLNQGFNLPQLPVRGAKGGNQP
jgi:phenylacetyl-CoA:acceptor oxidoreductase subunit 2